jgi:ribose transport system ATP-binding protein
LILMGETVLSIRRLTKRYPGVVALDDVTMDFERGEVHALVGENGAGKSTLIKAIAGALTPDAGEIEVDGNAHNGMTPHEAKQARIEVIYQEFNLVDSLSVAENICFGEQKGRLVNRRWMEARALDVLERLGVRNLSPRAPVGSLPSSQKQLVEIAKSVSRDAKILIMDEPSAPLSVGEVDRMFEVVRKLRADGVTILYISHRMEEIFEISDRVSVMRDGRYIATKRTSETSPQELVKLMVDRELASSYPAKRTPPGGELLRVEGLSGNGDRDINFTLRRGEILGLAGLVGAGRTELARLIYGADRLEGGKIFIKGKEIRPRLPSEAIACGIGLIPEDRKLDGCFLEKSIEWNCSISSIRKLSKGLVVDRKREREQALGYEKRLNIKTPSLNQLAKNLSSGNQQKVVLGRRWQRTARSSCLTSPPAASTCARSRRSTNSWWSWRNLARGF